MNAKIKSVIGVVAVAATLLTSGCAFYKEIGSNIAAPSNKGINYKEMKISNFDSSEKSKGSVFSKMVRSKIRDYGYADPASDALGIVVTGDISWDKDESTWKEEVKSDDGNYFRYYAKRTRSATVTYSVKKNGREVVSGSHFSQSNSERSDLDSIGAAHSKLQGWDSMNNAILEDLSTRVAQDLTPHQKYITVRLLSGDDESIDLANEYAERQRYDQAYAMFQQIAQASPNVADQAISLHNMGMIKFLESDFKEAYKLIKKANVVDPKNMEILDSIPMVENYFQMSKSHDEQVKAS
ncbi:hypothetical protein A3K86_01615 [Photobacterium jeanii]|uniref:Uncharacterized protein n=1 Tax=Photobacterium jeanii TaxID=858640 RepID=A0A178KKJ0_9GAMM|nr:hypothetical protein [Photobacterium jeanii]OAN17646.1 hypothetical protein A3K86_01615 [Photobacterium jeanii]PST92697.1 hypothetical protein C9I91_05870 [Photobacterium jeanii]